MITKDNEKRIWGRIKTITLSMNDHSAPGYSKSFLALLDRAELLTSLKKLHLSGNNMPDNPQLRSFFQAVGPQLTHFRLEGVFAQDELRDKSFIPTSFSSDIIQELHLPGLPALVYEYWASADNPVFNCLVDLTVTCHNLSSFLRNVRSRFPVLKRLHVAIAKTMDDPKPFREAFAALLAARWLEKLNIVVFCGRMALEETSATTDSTGFARKLADCQRKFQMDLENLFIDKIQFPLLLANCCPWEDALSSLAGDDEISLSFEMKCRLLTSASGSAQARIKALRNLMHQMNESPEEMKTRRHVATLIGYLMRYFPDDELLRKSPEMLKMRVLIEEYLNHDKEWPSSDMQSMTLSDSRIETFLVPLLRSPSVSEALKRNIMFLLSQSEYFWGPRLVSQLATECGLDLSWTLPYFGSPPLVLCLLSRLGIWDVHIGPILLDYCIQHGIKVTDAVLAQKIFFRFGRVQEDDQATLERLSKVLHPFPISLEGRKGRVASYCNKAERLQALWSMNASKQ